MATLEGKYEGPEENGQPHGKGKFIFATGAIEEGEWVNGKKEGKFIFTAPSGDREEREYGADELKTKEAIEPGSPPPAAAPAPAPAAEPAPAPAPAPVAEVQQVSFGDEWNGFGKEPGFVGWRIENKVPVPVPQDKMGKLYEGDSYIFLSTKQGTASLSWDIHFWIGKDSSVDEKGIAAYKTVELDEYLGGGPVQYRECQEHESQLFQSYFKKTGLEYLAGGVASGFAHVDRDSYETRLLHLKGKRSVRVKSVEAKSSSLNTGDVFILDLGLKLFLYNGKDANRSEKTAGFKMLQKIKDDERGGKAELFYLDDDPDCAEFWETLGGKIDVTNTGEDDNAAEKKAKEATKLFKVSDASGSLEFTEIEKDEKNRLQRSMLDTQDVFIVDADSEIFVWIGKGASANEKKEGMMRAMEYLAKAGKPDWTPITRVVEGAESPVFQANFFQWTPPKKVDFSAGASTGVAKTAEQKAIDVGAMQKRQAQAETPVDDGSGTVKIWRIENMEKAEVEESQYGQFYGGDSYIILYTYQKGGAEEYIIYFWLGRESSQDEKGAAALLTKALDDELQDRPVQCRVVQGKEPTHFRQLFKGKMVIHAGGKASGFKNTKETDNYDEDGVSLYHVKGSDPLNTVAVQVEEKAKSLNSGDCFVLLTPSTMYSWFGNGANESEQETAKSIAELLKTRPPMPEGSTRDVVVVKEGEEPEAFWTAIGGKGEYPKMREGEEPPRDPRLFQCTNMTGVFTVEEVPNFTQEDLIDDDVMLLDMYTTVFVWVGSGANETEKSMAMDTCQKYIDATTDGRDKEDVGTMQVKAGSEPAMFTTNFIGWDEELFNKNKFEDPYEKKLRELKEAKEKEAAEAKAEEEAAAAKKAEEEAEKAAKAEAAAGSSFTLEELQAGVPEGVDAANKQNYLADDVFQTLFGMDKDAFAKLPKWKQNKQKKEHKLF